MTYWTREQIEHWREYAAPTADKPLADMALRCLDYERDLHDGHRDRSQDTEWLRAGFLQRGAEIERLVSELSDTKREVTDAEERYEGLRETRRLEMRATEQWKGRAQMLRGALRRLSLAAQTTGGTAGRDDELVEAIEAAERALQSAQPASEDDQAIVDRLVREATDPAPADRLIWTGKHRAFWRPNAAGHTHNIEEAGRYTYEEAKAHVSGCGPEKKLEIMLAPADRPEPSEALEALERLAMNSRTRLSDIPADVKRDVAIVKRHLSQPVPAVPGLLDSIRAKRLSDPQDDVAEAYNDGLSVAEGVVQGALADSAPPAPMKLIATIHPRRHLYWHENPQALAPGTKLFAATPTPAGEQP